MRLEDGNIYIKCDSFPPGVVTCFSTRVGGTGTGEYEGMNPDPRRPWPFEIVYDNAKMLGEAAGFTPEDMYMLNQVHGDTVKKVTAADRGTGLVNPIDCNADALITNDVNVALTIFTADCTPILLYDPVKRAVAAVHAGWKSTALDIAGKTVRKMQEEYGSDASDIYAAIGPCISRCCFETHSDVPDAMRALMGVEVEKAITGRQIIENGEEVTKYNVDLKLINCMLLEKAGLSVENIYITEHCTACETDIFWSHRRMGTARGSLAAVIMLK